MNRLPESWQVPALSEQQKSRMEAWCVDLETTKAKQVTGRLRDRRSFCCLGRACEVARMPYKPGDIVPSALVMDLYGWVSTNCDVPEGRYKSKRCNTAAALNDIAELSFPEIAQVIRWAYLGGPRPTFFKESK